GTDYINIRTESCSSDSLIRSLTTWVGIEMIAEHCFSLHGYFLCRNCYIHIYTSNNTNDRFIIYLRPSFSFLIVFLLISHESLCFFYVKPDYLFVRLTFRLHMCPYHRSAEPLLSVSDLSFLHL